MSNQEVNMFEMAVRKKLRFATARGLLSVEELWEVPLRATSGFDLNAVAKTLNGTLKALSEDNFVESRKTKEQSDVELAFEIVKYVIAVKLAEEDAAEKKKAMAEEKQKLLRILAEKKDENLAGLSEKELQKRINALTV